MEVLLTILIIPFLISRFQYCTSEGRRGFGLQLHNRYFINLTLFRDCCKALVCIAFASWNGYDYSIILQFIFTALLKNCINTLKKVGYAVVSNSLLTSMTSFSVGFLYFATANRRYVSTSMRPHSIIIIPSVRSPCHSRSSTAIPGTRL